MAGSPRIWTIGHGRRTTEELADLLSAAGVDRVIDVRRYPTGKRQPHLSSDRLAADLPGLGIAYEWWGDPLGGFRKRSQEPTRHPAIDSFRAYAEHMDTELFRHALLQLETRVAGEALAIMCAETVWWHCHRQLIADALTLHGFEVIHLIDRAPGDPHRLHPAARPHENGWPAYDVATDRPIPAPALGRPSSCGAE